MATRILVFNEVSKNFYSGWQLCLQWGRYVHEDGETEDGYRFIWRRPDNSLQAARGQARIPSLAEAEELMRRAREAGWGENVAE